MTLMTPIGLIALLGVGLLLLIYLIKPVYQTKLIPTTYIWEKGLKLRKKNKKSSQLLDILSVICQILAVVTCAGILASPFISANVSEVANQNVIILDASADMMAETDGVTRFDRAKKQIQSFSEESFKKGRAVTLIAAGDRARVVVSQTLSPEEIGAGLDGLECELGRSDVSGAMEIANEITTKNELSEVYFYTSTEVQNAPDIHAVNVSGMGEWNLAITDVRAESVDNLYEISVDAGIFGETKSVDIDVTVYGVNEDEKTVRFTRRATLTDGSGITVRMEDAGTDIYKYDSIEARITARDGTEDSFSYDNSFVLYGGKKEPIRIQYVSSKTNNFFAGIFGLFAEVYRDRWEIVYDQVTEPSNAKTEGYDFYIFEHTVPDKLPSDGVVLLMSPDDIPDGLDLTLQSENRGSWNLSRGISHPIMRYVNPSAITVSKYRPIGLAPGFESLMQCEGDTLLAVCDQKKVAVCTVDLNYSNLALLPDFVALTVGMFDYFIPQTLDGYVFEVNSEIEVSGRGANPVLAYGDEQIPIQKPDTLRLTKVGPYRILQDLENGKKARSQFFVRVPAEESNFDAVQVNVDGLFDLERPPTSQRDIYIYLAVFLTVILLTERFLHSLKNS